MMMRMQIQAHFPSNSMLKIKTSQKNAPLNLIFNKFFLFFCLENNCIGIEICIKQQKMIQFKTINDIASGV